MSNELFTRRFTLVADKAEFKDEEHGTAVTGFIHGPIYVGDHVFIIYPDGTFYESLLTEMETASGAADKAENEAVTLYFKYITDPAAVPALSVITDIKPFDPDLHRGKSLDNPYLMALIYEVASPHLSASKDLFPDLFTSKIRESRYLVPIKVSDSPVIGEDGANTYQSELTMRYSSLKKPTGERLFPLFTDLDALKRAEPVLGAHCAERSMVISFADAVSAKEPNEEIVINPFGPQDLLIAASFR